MGTGRGNLWWSAVKSEGREGGGGGQTLLGAASFFTLEMVMPPSLLP